MYGNRRSRWGVGDGTTHPIPPWGCTVELSNYFPTLHAPGSTVQGYGRGERTSKPLEYHALGGQPFRIPSTEKYTIEKMKPLQGTTILFGHH